MAKRSLWVIGLVLALVLAGQACGPLAPPQSCGAGVGGVADEAKFAQYLSQMQLVNEATGQPGKPDPEGGDLFSSSDRLALKLQSKSAVSVQACVQRRTGNGKIPFDQTQALPVGDATFPLGSFGPGGYVIRVIIEGTLVKNLPFLTK